MAECCINMARTWEETLGRKYPPSEHSPMCPNYNPKRYQRVSLADDPHSASFVDTPEGVKQYLDSCEECGYKIEDVYLTEDQFEKLGDFAGF